MNCSTHSGRCLAIASEWFLPIGELGRHNSAFAAVQVVDNHDVYYGTFFGLQRIRP